MGPLSEMIIPESYNVNGPYSSDIGGINPLFYNYNSELMYDSWLTIGIVDGDQHNMLSTIGINYNDWDTNNKLTISDGALFVMDPLMKVVSGDEYILGELTISDDLADKDVVMNMQGKYVDSSLGNHWDEKGVTFELNAPTKIPEHCMIWFDGCNSCLVRNGEKSECTRLDCKNIEDKRCLRYMTGY